MRISDWSSDVCSSDLPRAVHDVQQQAAGNRIGGDEAHFQRHAEPEGLAAAAADEFMAARIVVVEIGRQGRYRHEPVRTHVGEPYEQPEARHAGDPAGERRADAPRQEGCGIALDGFTPGGRRAPLGAGDMLAGRGKAGVVVLPQPAVPQLPTSEERRVWKACGSPVRYRL